MKTSRLLIPNTLVITALLLLIAPSGVFGDDGCVTEKCHSKMLSTSSLHGPVGAKMCLVCHSRTKEDKHDFVLAEEKEDLCFACHEERRDMMLEDHLHTPVSDGNCVGCHDPHGSEHRYNLKGHASELCLNCHDPEQFSQEFVHGPVAAGDCNACHDPHASENILQLRSEPEQLCFTCHEEKKEILEKRHIHTPVADDCTNCHNPHSNSSKFMLSYTEPNLCFDCHDDIEEHAGMEHQHEPVAAGQCSKCHNPHATDHPNMFQVEQNSLCFTCHTDMKTYVLGKERRHGPVEQGDCSACHDPHGSENHRILRKNFPSDFYMPYDAENYAICFDCHNINLATDEKTETMTDFRDGDRNLHFVHVNKAVKGRSCKACHQVHASDQQKHVRESVPFGSMDWELPVEYTKLENGGSCVVGCHKPKEYRRK